MDNMEFEIKAKGALIDNGGKMELNCEVMLDIASTFNKTVEEVITDVYTHIKEMDFEN